MTQALTRRDALSGLALSAAALAGSAPAVAAEPRPDAAIFAAHARWQEARRASLAAEQDRAEARARYRTVRPAMPEAMRARDVIGRFATPDHFVSTSWFGAPEPKFITPDGWRWLSKHPPISVAGTPYSPGVERIQRGLAAAEEWEAAVAAADELSGLSATMAAQNAADDLLSLAEERALAIQARTMAGLACQAEILLPTFDGEDQPLIAAFLASIVRLGDGATA